MPSNRILIDTLDDEFTIKDIGSTLLDELAKGLYQPEEVVREYVANAVDAHRTWSNETGEEIPHPVQIESRNNGISILDYGIGMDEAEIREVKSVAVSHKRGSEIRLTGHKGVGIWAGLSFFERITLYTTKAGVDRGYELKIQFKNIVDSISDESHIGEVLNPNFSIAVYEEARDAHLTNVTLEAPTRSAEQFLDPTFIRKAVATICPCQIDPTFALHNELVSWYTANDFYVCPIWVDGKPVFRSYPSTVERFVTDAITIDDVPVAKFWRALNKDNSVLAAKSDQLIGFRLIADGFVLGGENPYSEARLPGYDPLRVGSYLEWSIGAVHIIDPSLRPSLKRDRFEESEKARQFVRRLRSWYAEVERSTRLEQETRNRRADYAAIEALVGRLQDSPPSAEDLCDAVIKHRELSAQEEKLRSYTPKKQSPDPKMEALKRVGKDRRRLLIALEPFTLGNSSVRTSTGAGTQPDVPEADRQPADVVCPAAENGHAAAGAPPATGTDETTVEEENTGEGTGSATGGDFTVPLNLVLGLVEEILSEEVSLTASQRDLVVAKLRLRLKQVVPDG